MKTKTTVKRQALTPEKLSTWQQNFLNSSCLDTPILVNLSENLQSYDNPVPKAQNPLLQLQHPFWKRRFLLEEAQHTYPPHIKNSLEALLPAAPKGISSAGGNTWKTHVSEQNHTKKFISNTAVAEKNTSVKILKGLVEKNISNVTPNKNGTGERSSLPSYFAVCCHVNNNFEINSTV